MPQLIISGYTQHATTNWIISSSLNTSVDNLSKLFICILRVSNKQKWLIWDKNVRQQGTSRNQCNEM